MKRLKEDVDEEEKNWQCEELSQRISDVEWYKQWKKVAYAS